MTLERLPPPVIIMGMHRSGTTLLTKILEACGVYWGDLRDEYNEALVFRQLNEKIFRRAGARWDEPWTVARLLDEPAGLRECVSLVRGEMQRIERQYLPQAGGTSLTALWPRFWGWKDPRNTFTLPLWLKIFPEARVVNVRRNGIDVAISLWNRETSRPEGRRHPHFSVRCLTLEGCLSLWEDYEERARTLPVPAERLVQIRFEDLVTDTLTEARRLCSFLGLEFVEDDAGNLPPVEPGKAYAYLRNRNEAVDEFVRKAMGNPLPASTAQP